MLCSLVLAGFDFVTAKVFLGLGEDNVLAQLWAVLLQTQLLSRVHCVLAGVVYALTRLFTHEPD